MPKKNKFIIFNILILMLIMSAGFSVSAASSVEFLDFDEKTQGDWVGNYGKDCFMIISGRNPNQRFQNISVNISGQIGYYEWWSTNNGNGYSDNEIKRREAGALFKNSNKNERVAGCFYASHSLMVNINVGDEPKIVSLYMLDYDEHGRAAEIYAFDEEGEVLLAEPVAVDMYDMGVYYRFIVSGDVYFMLDNLPPPEMNVCLSGIFFDSYKSAESAADADGAGNISMQENQTGGANSNSKPKTADERIILIILVTVNALILIPVVFIKKDMKRKVL